MWIFEKGDSPNYLILGYICLVKSFQEIVCSWDQTLNPEVTFLYFDQTLSDSSVTARKDVQRTQRTLLFDTWVDGGDITKSQSFEHPGLLCCDPWSDVLLWLLIAPAMLHQTDSSRGSVTWVQGKRNDMAAPRAFCLLFCLSPTQATLHFVSLTTPFAFSWKLQWLHQFSFDSMM